MTQKIKEGDEVVVEKCPGQEHGRTKPGCVCKLVGEKVVLGQEIQNHPLRNGSRVFKIQEHRGYVKTSQISIVS